MALGHVLCLPYVDRARTPDSIRVHGRSFQCPEWCSSDFSVRCRQPRGDSASTSQSSRLPFHPSMSAVLLPKRLSPSSLLRSLSRLSSTKAPGVPAEVVPPATTPIVGQAPNRAVKWSTNQQSRPQLASIPRFEQIDMALQPQPASAMEMIANEPVRLVHGRRAVCDGGESFALFTPYLSKPVSSWQGSLATASCGAARKRLLCWGKALISKLSVRQVEDRWVTPRSTSIW